MVQTARFVILGGGGGGGGEPSFQHSAPHLCNELLATDSYSDGSQLPPKSHGAFSPKIPIANGKEEFGGRMTVQSPRNHRRKLYHPTPTIGQPTTGPVGPVYPSFDKGPIRGRSISPVQQPTFPHSGVPPTISQHKSFQRNYDESYQRTRKKRSKSVSGSSSTSSDWYVIPRGKGHHQHRPPPHYRYKGKFDINTMTKKISRVPYNPPPPMPHEYPEPPTFFPPPPMPEMIPVHCSRPYFDTQATCGEGQVPPFFDQMGGMANALPSRPQSLSSMPYFQGGGGGAGVGGGFSNPPIPPGATILAQYVKDLDEQHSFNPMYPPPISHPIHDESQSFSYQHDMPPLMPHHSAPPRFERVMETCVPSQEVIEIYKKKKKRRPNYGHHLDQMRKDIISSLTSELQKLERVEGTKGGHDQQQQPVKVIVQPIQPVFYMPQNTTSQTSSQAAPSVVYVPRNVYVPVVKPVFVPRERVIVRPQVVHVARPVVIDRPVPVSQRPIVIEREKPIPYPVRTPVHFQDGTGQMEEHSVQEQYVYADNIPAAYGGRTGEFAYGLNYGYQPTDDRYRYVVSGCDYSGPVNIEVLSQGQVIARRSAQVEHIGGTHHGYQQTNYGSIQHSASLGSVHQYNHQYNTQPLVGSPHHFELGVEATDVDRVAAHHHQGIMVGDSQGQTGKSFEVLDPNGNGEWERVDSRILQDRYGSSAVRMAQLTNQDEYRMEDNLTGMPHDTASSSFERLTTNGLRTHEGQEFSPENPMMTMMNDATGADVAHKIQLPVRT
ncbi:hypothetical protein ACOME3_009270 [Neoechinorhynchus agilis]